jgi:hypothetical protein
MGLGVHMRGLLNIAVCPSGLRIGIMRIFGLFCRDFFVPWEEIEVTRKDWYFLRSAQLEFGHPRMGSLTIAGDLADQLARAASDHWPEPGSFPPKADGEILLRELKYWLASTTLVAAFFILAPRVLGNPNGAFPPIAVAIGFPAVVFGLAALFRYVSRTRQ